MNLSRFLHLRLQGALPDAPVYNGGLFKPDPPSPPDYAAAAKEQGNASLDAAIATGILNRPNQVSPLGSQTWNQTGSYRVGDRDVPIFTSNVDFTPQGRQIYDQGLNLQTGLMGLGQYSLDNATNTLKNPFDPSQNRDAIVDAMYRRSTRLLDPYYDTQQRRTEGDLINRGFSIGDEGYSRAMTDFQRSKDSAYGDAMDRALTGGAQQAIQEALISRSQPIQELNAIRTGALPQMPQFGSQTQAGGVGAAPIFAGTQAAGNAAMQRYGIDVGSFNNALSGLFGIGAAAAMPAPV